MNDPLSIRFDALVEDGRLDWLDVRRRVRRRPRWTIAAAAVGVATAAVVAAQLGALPWNAKTPAASAVVRSFASLTPTGIRLDAATAQARSVPLPNGSRFLVAPAKHRRICVALAVGSRRCLRKARRVLVVRVTTNPRATPTVIQGVINAPPGSRVEVRLANGRTVVIPVVWVGPPINAGFYGKTLRRAEGIAAVVLQRADGRVITVRIVRFRRSPNHKPLAGS